VSVETRAMLTTLQNYASTDTSAGWYGDGKENTHAYTFTLTPGMMNGIFFDDKRWCEYTVTCTQGTVRCRIRAARWSTFNKGTDWQILQAGESATVAYDLANTWKDAMVWLQVEAISPAVARAECRFTARGR